MGIRIWTMLIWEVTEVPELSRKAMTFRSSHPKPGPGAPGKGVPQHVFAKDLDIPHFSTEVFASLHRVHSASIPEVYLVYSVRAVRIGFRAMKISTQRGGPTPPNSLGAATTKWGRWNRILWRDSCALRWRTTPGSIY